MCTHIKSINHNFSCSSNCQGGGSGHEPAHIGYIGSGMLTGAVCGDIFSSPSSTSILDTIQTCTKDGGSALLVVKNYTGIIKCTMRSFDVF